MLRNDSVQSNPEQVYLDYHNDGLLDIFIGIGVFIIGLGLLTDIPYVFFATLPAIWLPAWRDAKKRYTAPRMKYIRFTEAQRMAMKTKALLTGLLLAGVVVFLAGALVPVLWSRSTGLLPLWLQSFIQEHFWLLPVVFGAGILSLLAWLYHLNRYFVYAALTLGIFTIASTFSAPFWLMFALTGISIALLGMMVFLRFVRTYPVEKDL